MIDAGAERWAALATSADGLTCMAASTWFVFASSDAGQNWIPTSATGGQFGGNEWSGVSCSSDGDKVVAVSRGGGIQLSTNAGTTWTTSSVPSFSWQAVASSGEGSRLVAVAANGPIYASTNSVVAWSATTAPNLNWSSVASSRDGSRLVATVEGGGIYIWQTTPTPKLHITPSGTGLLLSWIVPSMPFVLQENADLNTTDWVDVPTQPTLNLSNLHHEVSVPLSETNRFYRLKSL